MNFKGLFIGQKNAKKKVKVSEFLFIFNKDSETFYIMTKELNINIINKFVDYISYEKRMSEHTVVAYRTDIESFSEYICENYGLCDLTEVRSMQIRGWMAEQIDGGQTKTTVNRKLSSLKTFYKFLKRDGLLAEDPTLCIVSLKKDRKLPTFLTENEIISLINESIEDDSFESTRDKMVIVMLAGAGLRRSELVSMRLHSIDLYRNEIKVIGKRDKERLIPLNTYIKEVLSDYLPKRAERIADAGIEDEGWLIISNSGRKSYPELIYRIVRQRLSMVVSKSKMSPHILRHTFATLLMNGGADINSVKELLGHESLSATQIYTHNTIENIKKTYKGAHPRAN